MKIVLLTHPPFMVAQSMPRFARMLKQAYIARGHTVETWCPKAKVFNWAPANNWKLRKWAGYIDQYILFPQWVQRQLRLQGSGTLYVFCDQALGPWMPLFRRLPHVVHVHDLLALRSALHDIPENPTGFSGRMYQQYIRAGFESARNFISISHKTRDDLHHYSNVKPLRSEVVYNGLNYPYTPLDSATAQEELQRAGLSVPAHGMLLHVSGNQWYKNVPGVIRIYAQYARTHTAPLPLWLVGDIKGARVRAALSEVPAHASVVHLHGLSAQALHACYALARVFLFPSLEEGFGWPIIEAQACGCPVITSQQAPMNEVGGPDCFYVPRLHVDEDINTWAQQGASVVNQILSMEPADYAALRERCAQWPTRFQADAAIDGYLRIYREIVAAKVQPQNTFGER